MPCLQFYHSSVLKTVQVPREDIIRDLKEATGNASNVDRLVNTFPDPYAATIKSHALVICTEWDEFVNFDYDRIYNSMEKPSFIFDGRKILNHEKLSEKGFEVFTIGKRIKKQTTTSQCNKQ